MRSSCNPSLPAALSLHPPPCSRSFTLCPISAPPALPLQLDSSHPGGQAGGRDHGHSHCWGHTSAPRAAAPAWHSQPASAHPVAAGGSREEPWAPLQGASRSVGARSCLLHVNVGLERTHGAQVCVRAGRRPSATLAELLGRSAGLCPLGCGASAGLSVFCSSVRECRRPHPTGLALPSRGGCDPSVTNPAPPK